MRVSPLWITLMKGLCWKRQLLNSLQWPIYCIHHVEFKFCLVSKPCTWVVFSKSERSVFFSRFLKTFTIKQFKFGSADNSDLGFCYSWYQSQPYPIILNICRESWQKLRNMKPTFQCSGNMSFFLLQINGNL